LRLHAAPGRIAVGVVIRNIGVAVILSQIVVVTIVVTKGHRTPSPLRVVFVYGGLRRTQSIPHFG
jgi:hypothetical protein